MRSTRNRNQEITNQVKSNFADDVVPPKWKKDDRVLCRYLTLNPEIYYEAKIVKVTESQNGPIYSIHYQGWNSRHDERIGHADALLRFKKYTKEGAEKAKEELKAQQGGTKRRSSIPISEMMKESYNKINGTMKQPQPQPQHSSEGEKASMGTETNGFNAGAKFVRLSAPPPPKRPFPANSNTDAAKVIAPTLKTSIASDDDNANSQRDIQFPAALLRILVEDEKMVTKQMALPKLPARITVFDIFQQYRKEEADPNNSFADDPSKTVLGLLDYFETTLGQLLLYKFERPMFTDLEEKMKLENGGGNGDTMNIGDTVETNDGVRILYSKQFGFPHLVRMFVRFSEMLSYSEWTKQTYEAVILRTQNFLTFLDKNRKQFCDFEKDYFAASSEYVERFHKTFPTPNKTTEQELK